MRPEGVEAAIRELKRANRAWERFNAARDFEEAEDAWDAFLTHAGRIYTKLRAACHGQALDWPWWRKKMDERRDEELLAYIHQARNAETHRADQLTRRLKAGPHQFHIPNYGSVIENCVDHLSPLPVIGRDGNTYHPPARYKGRFLGYIDVSTIILLAINHLHDLVEEAASRLR